MNESDEIKVFIDPKLKKWVAFKDDQCILTLALSAARPVRNELKACRDSATLKKLIEKAGLISAIDLLSKRDYLKAEIKKKLKSKGIWDAQIGRVLGRLDEEGILDDRRYIRAYIESKAGRYGIKMLKVKLVAKGADKGAVDELLLEAGSSGEMLLIEKALKEAKRKGEDLGDFKTRQRWIQRLLRRGCSFERVRSFLDGMQSSYPDSQPCPLEEHFPQ